MEVPTRPCWVPTFPLLSARPCSKRVFNRDGMSALSWRSVSGVVLGCALLLNARDAASLAASAVSFPSAALIATSTYEGGGG